MGYIPQQSYKAMTFYVCGSSSSTSPLALVVAGKHFWRVALEPSETLWCLNTHCSCLFFREFNKPRRWRRGQLRLNENEFIFTYESCDTPESSVLFATVETRTKLNLEPTDKFEKEICKICCDGSRSPDNPEFGYFTLLFCRGRQIKEMYQELSSLCRALWRILRAKMDNLARWKVFSPLK